MAKVNIICPVCSKKGILDIDESILRSKSSGLFSVSVDQNFTCEHHYIAYIDQDHNVRDYFNLDYNIELPVIVTKQLVDDDLEEANMKFDLDLIKINLNANIITIIFKSIISGKSIIYIRDEYSYHDSIIPFFRAINEDSFDFKINLISEETYNNSKSKYKKSLVLNHSTVLNNPYKFIDLKRIKVEKRIVNSFLVEMNSLDGLIILKNHISQTYDLTVLICEYVKNQVKVKHIYAKNLIDFLEAKRGVIVSTHYLEYLIEIVNNYFEIPLKLSLPNYTGVF